jgi:serine/threonine protein kinase
MAQAPDEFFVGVGHLPPPTPAANGTLQVDLVDLRGGRGTLTFPSGATFATLRAALGREAVHFFVNGKPVGTQPDVTVEAALASHGGGRQILVDGRPRGREVLQGLVHMEIIEYQNETFTCRQDGRVHRLHRALSTPAGAAASPPFVYAVVRRLKKSIYGEVVKCVKLYHGPGGYYVPDPAVGTIEMFAVKVSRKSYLPEFNPRQRRKMEDPIMEVAIMWTLGGRGGGHPNVMGLTDVGHDAVHMFMIMPFCNGGELFDVIQAGGRKAELEVRRLTQGIMEGMLYCHQRGVSVNDTSLENTLLHAESGGGAARCVLMDFGMASMMLTEGGQERHRNPPNTAGKVFYLAPEVWKELKAAPPRTPYDGVHADVWSVAVMIVMMMSGCPIFDTPGEACGRFRHLKKTGSVSKILHQWTKHGIPPFSPELHDLLNRIFRIVPDQRIGVGLALEHPWVVGDLGDPARLQVYQAMMNTYEYVRFNFVDAAGAAGLAALGENPEYTRCLTTLVEQVNSYASIGGATNALRAVCRRSLPLLPGAW